jgi:hypothetical protein
LIRIVAEQGSGLTIAEAGVPVRLSRRQPNATGSNAYGREIRIMSESTYATGIAGAPAPVLSFGPLVLPVPGRAVDLQVRVSAPATGSGLPVILLSHGHGPSNHLSSLNGYAPLANYWAAHGFAVIQPTHLDSATLGLRDSDDPEAPLYWRSRARDMTRILDRSTRSRPPSRSSPAAWTGARSPWPGTRWAATPRACCSARGSPIRATGWT